MFHPRPLLKAALHRNAPPRFCIDPWVQIGVERLSMRSFSVSLAIAAFPALVAMQPAAAQNFEDRWSIIPKAHADPAPAVPDNSAPPPTAEIKPPVKPDDRRENETPKRVLSGKASFYSYRKAKTASGSNFDRNQLTVAHRSLPLGTRLRVTDVATKRSVVVRVTDRGPFIRGRILDLSLAAARNLGITDRGVVEVRAEVL
jgi:rare lipoprotein A (peptidoglycan hydrolase)